jgi:predicted ferric reductase
MLVLVGTGPDAFKAFGDWLRLEHDRLPWYATRITALLAYLALSGSVVYGLLLSTGIADRIAHRAISVTLHRDLAGVGLRLALVHASVLMIDRAVPYVPIELVVPLIGPYRPVWVALGQLALGLSILVVASSYLRKRIGHRLWRLVHYATIVAWLAATTHGISTGTDSSTTWAMLMYTTSLAAVAGLLAIRVLFALIARRADTIGR